MPVSVYKKLFCNYVTKFGPIQANLKVYNSTGVNALAMCVLYCHAHKSTQALIFNITDIEGSILFSCADALLLGLLQASEKLDKKIPSVPNLN